MVRSGIAALCACLLSGCIPGYVEHEDAGDRYVEEQRFAEAVFEYTLALQEGRSVELLIRRAQAWERLGRFDDAILDCDAAVALDPQSSDAFLGRGTARLQEILRFGERDSSYLGHMSVLKILAMSDLDMAVFLAPRDPQTLRSRAYALYLLDDHPGALADLDRVLRMGAGDSWAYDLRGKVRQAMGDWQGSTAEFTVVILLSPWEPGGFAQRGRGYLNVGKFAEAEEDLSRSLELNSLDGSTWHLRALVRIARNNIQGACRDACMGSILGDRESTALVRAFACECP